MSGLCGGDRFESQPERKATKHDVERGDHHQRQDCGEAQAKDDDNRHVPPPLAGLAFGGPGKGMEVVGYADGHWDQADYRGRGCQQHGPQPRDAGLRGGRDEIHATLLQLPGVGEQHDGVVHDHAGKAGNANAGHDDAEGHDQQQSDGKGFAQEGPRLVLGFLFAGVADLVAGWQLELGKPPLYVS